MRSASILAQISGVGRCYKILYEKLQRSTPLVQRWLRAIQACTGRLEQSPRKRRLQAPALTAESEAAAAETQSSLEAELQAASDGAQGSNRAALPVGELRDVQVG